MIRRFLGIVLVLVIVGAVVLAAIERAEMERAAKGIPASADIPIEATVEAATSGYHYSAAKDSVADSVAILP